MNGNLDAMLTIQRRHSAKCPDRNKGPNFLKCRGRCRLRIIGTANGVRVRQSLKTCDVQRAGRRLAELEQHGAAALTPRKSVAQAIDAFHTQRGYTASETQKKYRRVLGYLANYCQKAGVSTVDGITLETVLDTYALDRATDNWTWLNEVGILRNFLSFCVEREWINRNPAKGLRCPRLVEANNVVPFTTEQIISVIAAADRFGSRPYERLRARAMVLLLRYTGMRISDVVTLSRDHVQGNRLEKRAIKNKKLIRLELPAVVLEALEALPLPKSAPIGCRLYFASGNGEMRSAVKSAQRTLAVIFERAGVPDGYPHRFRHTLATEILGKGGATIEDAANILGDDPATIRRHYAKWSSERQAHQDEVFRRTIDTKLAQAEEPVSKC
jgi:integrase